MGYHLPHGNQSESECLFGGKIGKIGKLPGYLAGIPGKTRVYPGNTRTFARFRPRDHTDSRYTNQSPAYHFRIPLYHTTPTLIKISPNTGLIPVKFEHCGLNPSQAKACGSIELVDILRIDCSSRIAACRVRGAERLQLIAGIKKAGLVGGTHRFLAFRRPLLGHTHRFLATGTTVKRRLRGRYRVPGRREGLGKGLRGGTRGYMRLDRVSKQVGGQEGHNCGQASPQAVPQTRC